MILHSLWHGQISVRRPTDKTMAQIAAEVAQEHRLTVDDLKGRAKSRAVAHPRQIAMTRCMEETHNSSTSIGRFFGGRDHTTVLDARKAVERRRADAQA